MSIPNYDHWTDKAIELIGACTCHEAYVRRGKEDPDCLWHQLSYDLMKLLEATDLAGRKAQVKVDARIAGGNRILNFPESHPSDRQVITNEVCTKIQKAIEGQEIK